MRMRVSMPMLVPGIIMPLVVMLVTVIGMVMIARTVIVLEVNIKFGSSDTAFCPAGSVKVVALELELLQLGFQAVRIRSQIDQRAHKHVTADAANEVEIEGFHESRSS